MIFVLNFAEASAASTYGEPPALLTTTSRRPWSVDDRLDERLDRLVVADVAGVELVRQTVDGPARARHDGGALVGEDRADAGADAANSAGDEHHAVLQTQADGTVDGVNHCASVPSKCLLR